MLKKNCSNCEKKIDRSFKFCPWCGKPTKKLNPADYGMLGLDDEVKNNEVQNPLSMIGGPLGGMINQITKQLSKELQNMDLGESSEKRGIEIRFSTGMPVQRVTKQTQRGPELIEFEPIDEEEKQRRKNLPIISAESKIRRLPEGIIYEIETPGVKTKKDVAIIRLENSLEVRAYSRDNCYIKTIPLKFEVLKYVVKDNKVLIQIKN